MFEDSRHAIESLRGTREVLPGVDLHLVERGVGEEGRLAESGQAVFLDEAVAWC